MNKNNIGFTLLELIVVVIIIGILAGIGIPIYLDAIDTQKGSTCQLNIETITYAWRIYNDKNPSSPYNPAGTFTNIASINTFLGTVVDERYFGSTSTGIAGFYMNFIDPFYNMYTDRLSGRYQGKRIISNYNANDGSFIWSGNWPL